MTNTVIINLTDYDRLKNKEHLYKQSVLEMARLTEENETLREMILKCSVHSTILTDKNEIDLMGVSYYFTNYDELLSVGFTHEELYGYLVNEIEKGR